MIKRTFIGIMISNKIIEGSARIIAICSITFATLKTFQYTFELHQTSGDFFQPRFFFNGGYFLGNRRGNKCTTCAIGSLRLSHFNSIPISDAHLALMRLLGLRKISPSTNPCRNIPKFFNVVSSPIRRSSLRITALLTEAF